jgi:hypothetical protein
MLFSRSSVPISIVIKKPALLKSGNCEFGHFGCSQAACFPIGALQLFQELRLPDFLFEERIGVNGTREAAVNANVC